VISINARRVSVFAQQVIRTFVTHYSIPNGSKKKQLLSSYSYVLKTPF